jgi:hypothetical protein
MESKMRVLWIAAIGLILGGCTGSTGADDDSVDVTGKWSGTITVTMGGAPESTLQTLVLTQSGEAVTGTAQFGTDPELGNASGKLIAGTLNLDLRDPQSSTASCALNFKYSVTATTLTLTSASGQICDNGTKSVSGGSGTLTRK